MLNTAHQAGRLPAAFVIVGVAAATGMAAGVIAVRGASRQPVAKVTDAYTPAPT